MLWRQRLVVLSRNSTGSKFECGFSSGTHSVHVGIPKWWQLKRLKCRITSPINQAADCQNLGTCGVLTLLAIFDLNKNDEGIPQSTYEIPWRKFLNFGITNNIELVLLRCCMFVSGNSRKCCCKLIACPELTTNTTKNLLETEIHAVSTACRCYSNLEGTT